MHTATTTTTHERPTVREPRAPEALALEPGEGEALWFLDHFVTMKVDARSGAAFSLAEVALPAGGHTPFHRHLDEDETFYVLAGEVTFHLEGGRVVDGKPGSFVHVPRGVAHGFHANTDLRLLVIAGHEGFFALVRDAGAPAAARTLPPPAEPDLPAVGAAAEKRAIELLGPLPE